MQISSYLDKKKKQSFMYFSAKIVNFEKMDNRDREICDDTLHILFGKVKMGSTKSGFAVPSH